MIDRDFIKNIFSIWVIVGAVLVAIIMLGILFAAIQFLPGDTDNNQQPTAILNAIRAPTATPILPTALPTSTPTPTLSPDQITAGVLVEINGTGGDGLRIRVSPGLDSQIWQVAAESEVFRVEDGPTEIDGYIWWFLSSPQDETRRGWAVGDFLKPVSGQ